MKFKLIFWYILNFKAVIGIVINYMFKLVTMYQ